MFCFLYNFINVQFYPYQIIFVMVQLFYFILLHIFINFFNFKSHVFTIYSIIPTLLFSKSIHSILLISSLIQPFVIIKFQLNFFPKITIYLFINLQLNQLFYNKHFHFKQKNLIAFSFMNRLQKINKSISFPHIYDYIIVGGGISGLQSALILTQNTKNILVIQALPQLGGRIASLSVTDLPYSKTVDWILNKIQHFKKVKIQKGATWIQQRHTVLRQLCRTLGIPMKIQYCQGDSTYLADKDYTPKQLWSNNDYGPDLKKFLQQIDSLAETYRIQVLDASKITEKYKQLLKKYDSMTLQQYLKQTVPNKKVRALLQNFFEHTECISVDVNSMHEVLAKHGRSNDVGILKQFLGAEQHQPSYLIQGTQVVIQKYIQAIEKNIKNYISTIIKYNSQVIEVDNTQKDLVTVTYLQNHYNPCKLYCKKVICAAPLQVARNINFTNISQNKRIVFDNQLRTNAIKVFIVFKTAFWRQKNRTGDGLFSNQWLANMCHDISPQDQSCGIMVFFLSGKKYYNWKVKFNIDPQFQYTQKLNYMKNIVAKMFNYKQGSKEYEQRFQGSFIGECGFMQNPFIRSGFQSNTRPGTFTQIVQRGGDLSALYDDQHNISFVGSQFSDSFASYIEGAIRITRKKVYKLLGKPDPLQSFVDKVNVVTKH